MTRVVNIERRGGLIMETVEVDMNQLPPPERWQRCDAWMAGDDACLIENLLVRGMDPGDASGMFALATETRRQDLSHEQDTAGIVAHCQKHGITVEPGQIIDAEGPPGFGGVVRTFRNWRLSAEGCAWPPPPSVDDAFLIDDGKTYCRVCGQERKPC